MEFRVATQSDVKLLALMNEQLIRDEGHRNQMSLPELEKRMSGWLGAAYQAVIFSNDDSDLGYCLYKHEPEWTSLRQLFVLRNYRRQGIGRSALKWLADHQFKGISRIRIDVLINNSEAIAFWKSVGFVDYCTTMELDLSRLTSE